MLKLESRLNSIVKRHWRLIDSVSRRHGGPNKWQQYRKQKLKRQNPLLNRQVRGLRSRYLGSEDSPLNQSRNQ